tara:strand:+ start:1052 stop:1621 length:570 start_codon:yes stop_codon:yes gene_type:complete
MANADTPHGFTPMRHLTGGVIRANEYEIANGEADSFSFGDIVQLDSDGFLDAFANNENAIGVFYGVQYTDDTTGDVKFERKWTGGSTFKANTKCKALVYDDPNITFKVQAGGAAIAQANVGELCNVILTAGDATFLNSKHEADMSTLANTAKVLRILRIVDEPGNEVAENAEIEVVINNHLFGTQNAGI